MLVLAFRVGDSRGVEPDICQSPVTTDIVACAKGKLERSKATMELQLKEIHRLLAERKSDMAALTAAQTAWQGFVEVDCKAVYEHWIDGTIRGPMAVGCELGHVDARNCELWWTYLEHEITTLTAPPCPGPRPSS
jgi:uncharacterized protein YecT (DUF1311 family)